MACISLVLTLAAAIFASAGQLSTASTSDTCSAAATLASNLMSYYNSSEHGVLPQPYWWWESGSMWTTLITYWHYTGDATYNNFVSSALCAQSGSTNDFMGSNTLGNDDQLWWAIAAMTAAEYKLPAPSSGPSWLQLAQNVYNEVQGRWDTSSCAGGLHWEISPSTSGYSYKSAIANGLYFQLAARLARFTGNSQYSDEAETVWKWVRSVGLVANATYTVYDGTDSSLGCTSLDHDEWSYNVATYLYGAAMMLDYTGDSATWSPHLDGLITAATSAFTNDGGILLESKCEADCSCDTDQLSFKAYLSRWMAATAALVPSTASQITPVLQASSEGAVASCNAGPGQGVCGFKWTTNAYDDTQGVGQQLAALEVVQGLLASGQPLPSKAASRKMSKRFEA